MTAKIPLQNGEYAIVDKEDYERCMEHTWTYHNKLKTVNATINGATVQLTSFIRNFTKTEEFIMHKDGNNLNFTKNNLIDANGSERIQNNKGHSNSTSMYKGVSWDKSRSKWVVQARALGKNVYIGRFDNEDEAAKAYNEYINEQYGEHAYKNVIGANNNKSSEETKAEKVEMARKKKNSNNKFLGVRQVYKDGYSARITVNGKREYLGYFSTPEQAAKAYDKKAYELYGDKAILNFPELIEGGNDGN